MTESLQKIANPLGFYQHPKEVEKDNSLTNEQKLKLLQNWLDDVNQQQTAEAENMPSFDETRYHVAAIEELIEKYKNKL